VQSHALVPLRYVALALVAAAIWALVPLWAPAVFAVWTALLFRPLERRLGRMLGGTKRAAAAITVVVVALILVPLLVLSVSLTAAALDAQSKLRESKQVTDLVKGFLPGSGEISLAHLSPSRVLDFLREHAKDAAGVLKAAFGALSSVAIALVVYVAATYACLVNGPRAYVWLEKHSLLSPRAFGRLSRAFEETGRGLLIGIGGTALLQGTVATLGYAVVGAPLPLLLGFLTTLAALIPSVGTALVWVPVTVAMLATDHVAGGVVLGAIGCLTSVVDNFVRPWLSRFGELEQPTIVTFAAMLGGVVAFGGLGIVLGPLFTRLAMEALELWREARNEALEQPRAVAPARAARRAP
jgi:predicted PurR-regulated permease PerM